MIFTMKEQKNIIQRGRAELQNHLQPMTPFWISTETVRLLQ